TGRVSPAIRNYRNFIERGDALTAAVESGFETHGFEISRTAAEGLDPRVHLTIAGGLRDAAYPSDHFDLVILWHVLEHLPDPQDTLEEVRRILTPGGRLALAVPNFSSLQARLFGPAWFHLDLPRHLYHFPAGALQRLSIECGFHVERVDHLSLRQNPFGWVQSALNAILPARRNELYSLLKRRANASTGLTGIAHRLAYWMGMPAAVVAAALTAVFRSGATVSMTLRKPTGTA
ncbi:MAG: class I SAM-dependent methyltransferase, partial [Planctomycetaceae bacterium]